MLRFFYGLVSGLLVLIAVSFIIPNSLYTHEESVNVYSAKANLNAINLAMQIFYDENSRLPTSEEGLKGYYPNT